ncbi:rhomboid family intramembrane serine protease [Bartonella sp. B17]
MRNVDHQYDNSPLLPKRPKESLLNIPFIIVVLIVFCFCIYFILQYFFPYQLYIESFEFFSFIPVLFKTDPLGFCYTIVSYSFMHSNFEHIAINMIWFLIFGSPLVSHFGGLRFLIFWVVTAVISALTYLVFNQDSAMPLVGASGVVFGMMGAFARYDFSFVHFDRNVQNRRRFGSLLSIRKALCSRTVLVYVSVWLISNFIIGISSSLFEENKILIAWEAHIGGLFSGFLLVGFFDISQGKRQSENYDLRYL